MSEKTEDTHLSPIEQLNPEGGSRYGVVIGIEKHQDTRQDLRYARADAQAMYDLMIDPECGMFPQENVALLVDEAATFMNIRLRLDEVRQKAGKNDTVWVYYAGHCAPAGGEFYWLPHDVNVVSLRATGLSRRFITNFFDEIRAQCVITFLDCCHASAMGKQKIKTRKISDPKELFKTFKGKGSVVLAATDDRQLSVESDDWGHGAFTYYLVQGLKGAADTAQSGVITLDNLWKYLEDKVSKAAQQAGNPQTPVMDGPQTHKIALTVNPQEIGRRKRITEYLCSLIGLGKDRLATEEVEYCIKIIQRCPIREAEKTIVSEFDSLLSQQLKISTFKQLIIFARDQEQHKQAVPFGVKSNIEARRALNQLEKDFVKEDLPLSQRIAYYRDFAADWPGTKASKEALILADEMENEILAKDEIQSPPIKYQLNESQDFAEKWLDMKVDEATSKLAYDLEKRLPSKEKRQHPITDTQLNHGTVEEIELGDGVKLEMVYLKGGVFQMGSPDTEEDRKYDEGPVHKVELDGFWIGKFPITQEQYEAVMGWNPSEFIEGGRPVECVSWADAAEFLKRLRRMERHEYRLLTEAEWEYACRAGTQTYFNFGDRADELKDYAWFNINSARKTHMVGLLKPNAWGIFDMHGNVWEWCADWYNEDYYNVSPQKNPKGPKSVDCEYCVLRGCALGNCASDCRSARRRWVDPFYRNLDIGFRLARDQ